MGAGADLKGMADVIVFQQGGEFTVGIQKRVLILCSPLDPCAV